MGRSETAIQTIATARAQRDVYFVHEEAGERLFSLAHGPFTLDCIARNSAEDHELMDQLYQHEGREGFTAAWFRRHGYDEAARRVEAWWQHHRAMEESYADPETSKTNEETLALRGAE
jgi:hypothetical protein